MKTLCKNLTMPNVIVSPMQEWSLDLLHGHGRVQGESTHYSCSINRACI